jgi:UDP-N-acetylglucosamine 2-epimerase (non-hydrolysing)
MSRRRILSVVGARPNFMKIAPIARELSLRADGFEHVLVHTGQHYDDDMTTVFIDELGLPTPDLHLDVGSGSHAQQLGRVIERLEGVLVELRPDMVLVPGDVNSTLGATLAATACGIPVGHVEAGLRSFDRTMPEEINRVAIDALSALLFIHSAGARDNLLAEGCEPSRIHFVGNTMIDTLALMSDRIAGAGGPARHGLSGREYVVVTLHRPALVDGNLLPATLQRLTALSRELPVVFPAHPRTRAAIEAVGFVPDSARFHLLEPLGYLEFLSLVAGAAGVVTDSGGVQEETTFLGVPCFTLRDTTERPITVELGTNTVLGLDPDGITRVPALLDQARTREHRVPPLWDGSAAQRIADVLAATVKPSEPRAPAIA